MTDNLHPAFGPKLDQLRQLLREQGLETDIGSGGRSMEEQARIYAQGRTAPGPIVTYATPGSSYHNFGAAVDLVPKGMDEEKAGKLIGQIISANPDLGLAWGGSFKNLYDPLHVQLGVPLKSLQAGDAPIGTPPGITAASLGARSSPAGVPMFGGQQQPSAPDAMPPQQQLDPLTIQFMQLRQRPNYAALQRMIAAPKGFS